MRGVDTFVERCAGIDIGKVDVKACVRVLEAGRARPRSQVRTFSTTTVGLLALRDWLLTEQVTLVGMESTGVYWKPVFYLLEADVECWLLNPRHMKAVPGRKSDVADASWIAQLVQHGLVQPSFVPPPPIRALRDLTRYRSTLVHERTREVQRLHAVLEDAGIKLTSVASDVLGVSGRDMLEAMIRGERDPKVLAEMARARMRSKIPALVDALTGRFTEHHALLCRLMIDRVDAVNRTIDALSAQIATLIATTEADHQPDPPEPPDPAGPGEVESGEQRGTATSPATRSLLDIQALLTTIPGVSTRTAEVMIAETGADMRRFPSPAHITSWAGMCPGNNESAGKHFSGRTRKGDPSLSSALCEAAQSAARTKGTYLAERYRRIARRRGAKRAMIAVGRSILEAAYHIMINHVPYKDLGPEHYLRHAPNPARRIHRLMTELRALGVDINITPAAA